MNENFRLSAADMKAVTLNDYNYLNAKGARLYGQERYSEAIEYYHLAAALGSINAVSNLGYCYLYGRSCDKNLSLALAYFERAANEDCVDAAYKLGNIYETDKWGMRDEELAVYWFRRAACLVLDIDWNDPDDMLWSDAINNFPSLCFALGRNLIPGGIMPVNIDLAYRFLIHAETGYMRELTNGYNMYQDAYNSVRQLLDDPVFDDARKKFSIDDDEDDEEPF